MKYQYLKSTAIRICRQPEMLFTGAVYCTVQETVELVTNAECSSRTVVWPALFYRLSLCRKYINCVFHDIGCSVCDRFSTHLAELNVWSGSKSVRLSVFVNVDDSNENCCTQAYGLYVI